MHFTHSTRQPLQKEFSKEATGYIFLKIKKEIFKYWQSYGSYHSHSPFLVPSLGDSYTTSPTLAQLIATESSLRWHADVGTVCTAAGTRLSAALRSPERGHSSSQQGAGQPSTLTATVSRCPEKSPRTVQSRQESGQRCKGDLGISYVGSSRSAQEGSLYQQKGHEHQTGQSILKNVVTPCLYHWNTRLKWAGTWQGKSLAK